jgi:mono/diheme cytochrome c family protein
MQPKKPRDWFSAPKVLVVAMMVGGVVVLLSRWNPADDFEPVNVVAPQQLSAVAQDGKLLFEANCAACHGEIGGGTNQGPPLVHDIYNPGHHADYAFVLAARNGVRAHHWPFGNMPPQPQVTEDQAGAIVQYVRALQQANGIVSRPHQM